MVPISAYAVATPGLESIVAGELTGLGFVAGKIEAGGVPFECDLAGLYRANLQLRTATRVLVRISQFKATGFKAAKLAPARDERDIPLRSLHHGIARHPHAPERAD